MAPWAAWSTAPAWPWPRWTLPTPPARPPPTSLDVGGGATDEKVAKAVGIILSDPKVDRVLVNVFGGILRCDVAARGITMAYEEHQAQQPLIVRMLGTNLEEGKSILAGSGLNVTFADTLTEVTAALSATQPGA